MRAFRITPSLTVPLILVALVATDAAAQRRSRPAPPRPAPRTAPQTPERDADREIQDWLARCRDGREYGSDRERYCEVRERRVTATRLLDVDGQENGSVTVHGWERSDVRVVAKIQTTADDYSEARSVASEIEIETDDGRIRATVPSGRRRSTWSVSFEIWTPRLSGLNVSTYNGGISVDDIDARVDLQATNGGINLRSMAGDVRAETTNGPITVDLWGDRWRGAGLDARTTNGPVNLTIPESYSARLETGTTNGALRVDFPVTLQGEISRRVTTQLGSGGPPIRAITTNGPVVIRRR
jgi:DUF4097 and DUF4098 domain-containing protein YvlB